MSPEELNKMASEIYGRNWQAPLARFLECDPVTVNRWARGRRPVPHTVKLVLSFMQRDPLLQDIWKET